ncbi:hypothetical protein RG2014_061 [Delftia phage RG-2014]|uniref:Uncharacterized protein n=1 Tax=Delftia phage RG-2014 TaxID=1563661 RepID=A0A097PAQ1_9CAUD|nr:hypothetical protein RG2014_061 [Delftia phage RG-2014]AIU44315.2 hypothetical protein RG2014_061 [Delftia phage RG-2014]
MSEQRMPKPLSVPASAIDSSISVLDSLAKVDGQSRHVMPNVAVSIRDTMEAMQRELIYLRALAATRTETTPGVEAIQLIRSKQISKGYTAASDFGERSRRGDVLIQAAIALLCNPSSVRPSRGSGWPWDDMFWPQQGGKRGRISHAGALIAAHLEMEFEHDKTRTYVLRDTTITGDKMAFVDMDAGRTTLLDRANMYGLKDAQEQCRGNPDLEMWPVDQLEKIVVRTIPSTTQPE